MLIDFFTIGGLMLFSAMLPGPDFALVVKNTILHSRRAGFFTAFGIGSALLVHITYCVLGLGLIIANSPMLFKIVKYIGAIYLIYLGIDSFRSKQSQHTFAIQSEKTLSSISEWKSFRQGFLCNVLNPKATLFFLALFSTFIKPNTPFLIIGAYAIEMVTVVTIWFCTLTVILSHPQFAKLLNNAEILIAKLLGIILISLGLLLFLIN